MPLQIDDLDGENLDYFSTARRTISICRHCADCKLLRYPPTTACPWCMTPEVDVDAGRGQGRGALLHRSASRDPAGLPGAHALHGAAGRSRHAEGQADRARGAARRRQSVHAGRHAGAAGHGEAGRHRHARAHGVRRCRRRVCRCRNGRSTRPRRSRQMCGAIRRNSALSNKMGRLFDSRPEEKPPPWRGFSSQSFIPLRRPSSARSSCDGGTYSRCRSAAARK